MERVSTRVRPGALLAIAAAAFTIGCRGESRNGPVSYQARIDRAVQQIEQETGAKFKTPPKFEIRSRDQVREFLVKKFDESAPAQELAGQEAAYKVMGLLPDSMHLRQFLLDVLTEQVVGYYDPSTKLLYIVQGVPDEVVGLTLTHELVHALQDQYFSLDSLQKIKGDDDRSTAAQSVIEGQATYESTAILAGGEDKLAARMGGWDQLRTMIRDNQSAQPIFSSAPTIIQESLLFPYINGADFVRRAKEHGEKFPFTSLPTSTEQVMHDQAYFGAQRDEPTKVTLPAVTGATGGYQNVMGEFGTRLFLYEHLQDQNASIRAATGWDGDRFVVLETPKGKGIAWVTVWDSPFEAAEFVDALGAATAKRYRAKLETKGDERTLQGRGRSVRLVQREIGGRNVVLFVDVPDGTSTNVLDLGRVQLSQ